MGSYHSISVTKKEIYERKYTYLLVILACLVIVLELVLKLASLSEYRFFTRLIPFQCLGIRHQSPFEVTQPFHTVSLAYIPLTIQRLKLDHTLEIYQGFVPFLHEYVNLAPSLVSFHIFWELRDSFR